ncbi:metal ABC transporter solute-binding protein, Zn/Mn family [Dysgonomonas sp. 25]|uniref:metal ABC transporter solute-binding protein, Zn/Mn family n=1 Tax=Dysgonomonas sp. 25 TaxID=2302933 RepID=UPI0013D73C63|nr:zinc ABC transporter substrate-binding protein [Dysgonomonas sp. 25]NDV69575.1 hypothetical protein [Dysgonomonas sp. 25]
MRLKPILFILPVFLFLACKPKSTSEEKAVLTVSIEPQKYFLEQLAGDKYTVHCAIPSGANPEAFDPTPSQLVNISKSKAYFAVGTLTSERVFVEKVKGYNKELRIVDCSSGVALLDNDHHHHCEFHSAHEQGDPHIWSSPSTARIIAKNMYEELVKMDAANKDFYEANYAALSAEIDKTDEQIKAYLAKATNRSFIIYHPALSYFAEEYGLHQLTIEHDGKTPSPAYLAKLVDKSKAEHIKVVFIQQEFDAKNAETLANEIGAKTYVINLLSYDWNSELTKIAQALAHE